MQGTQGAGSGSHLRKADPNSQDAAELSKRVRELELENEFFKKSGRLLRQGHVDEHSFAVICHYEEEGSHKPRYTVTMMAKVLQVSRAGYYRWKKRQNQSYPLSTPRGFRDQIADDVKEIFAKHNGSPA